jgi:O-antigen ligase
VLIAYRLASSPRYRALLILCLAPAFPAIFASDHETSKMAVAGGAFVLFLQILAPRVVKPLIAAAWIIACVAVVPLTAMAYELQAHKVRWLQDSAQHRIVIWGVTSSKIAEAPFFGHGMVSARELWLREKERPTYEFGTPFMVSPGPHAHNVYLQVWFDTGLVGVAFLLVIGLFVLRSIAHVAADHQPALYAAFATNALLAASGFSIWTRWFLASFALSAIFALLALRFAAMRCEDKLAQDKKAFPIRPGAGAERVLGREPFDSAPTGPLPHSH